MLIATTENVPGYAVEEVVGEVLGSSVVFRLFNSPKGSVDGRTQAIDRMIAQAEAIGANAIVGMRFDSMSVSDGNAEVCAYGTAVRARKL